MEAKDIAVISPYRGQIRKIVDLVQMKKRTKPELNWSDVTIGSTEELQASFLY